SRIDVSTNAVTSVAVEGQPVALAVGPAVAQSGRSSGSGGGSSGGGGGGSSCSGTLKSCGVTCVDLAVDPANCGACGNACARRDTPYATARASTSAPIPRTAEGASVPAYPATSARRGAASARRVAPSAAASASTPNST